MKWFGRSVLSLFFIFISISMILKGIDLWSLGSNVDGDGIGVYFLGLELNDQVAEASIPKYALGFLIISTLPILAAFVLVRNTLMKTNKQVTLR